MKTLMTALTLPLLLSPTPGEAAPAAPAPVVIEGVEWTVDGRRPNALQLIVPGAKGRSSTTAQLDRDPTLRAARTAIAEGRGPIGFVIDREAGRFACSGRASAGRGQGTCRFTSSPAYEAGLGKHGIGMRDRTRQLPALALVDARLAAIDSLAQAGQRPPDADKLIAATAMSVSGDYVRALTGAGLRITSFDDLIACRALGVDGGYVRSLVAAGHRGLTSQAVIPMRALGVTGRLAAADRREARR